MLTEVGARDLGDKARYNMLEVLFLCTHCKTLDIKICHRIENFDDLNFYLRN